MVDSLRYNSIDLLQSILSTPKFNIPKVTEITSSSSSSIRSRRALHQLVEEKEREYVESLVEEVQSLTDKVKQLQSHLQTIIGNSSFSNSIWMKVLTDIHQSLTFLRTRFMTELIELSSSQPTPSLPKKQVTQEVILRAMQVFTKDMRSPLEPIRSLAVNRFDHLIQNSKHGKWGQ